VYVSVPDPLELHYFICLAILTICKEPLEELDQSEVRSMLLSLPAMDVDRVSIYPYWIDSVRAVPGPEPEG